MLGAWIPCERCAAPSWVDLTPHPGNTGYRTTMRGCEHCLEDLRVTSWRVLQLTTEICSASIYLIEKGYRPSNIADWRKWEAGLREFYSEPETQTQ